MNYIKFGEYSERSPGYRLPKRATKSPEGFSPFFIYTKKWYQCRAVDQNGNKCTVQVRAKRYDNLSDLEKARIRNHEHMFPLNFARDERQNPPNPTPPTTLVSNMSDLEKHMMITVGKNHISLATLSSPSFINLIHSAIKVGQ